MNKNTSRNKTIISNNPMLSKQKGVVLLSSVIFLILILGLLKITLGSSNIAEKKAGIDVDISLATENSQAALREIEDAIILSPLADVDECQGGASASNECAEARLTHTYGRWAKNKIVEEFGYIYDGQTAYGECGYGKTHPLWQCVDWGKLVHKTYHKNTNYKSKALPSGTRYIVERFKPKALGDEVGLVLRVTTMGFGQSSGDKEERVTNVMYEATYAIPSPP